MGTPEQISPVCDLSASVRAGAARRDITPPVGIYNRHWGAARFDIAEGVHRPLSVNVLAIDPIDAKPSGGKGTAGTFILASMDIGWWFLPDDEWFVRGHLIKSLGLDPARVMLAATHTHAGASCCSADADKPGGQFIAGFLQQIRDGVLDAAREAIAAVQPATLTFRAGRCDLATNRDLPEPGGKRFVCGYRPDASADDTLLVGRVTADGDGRTIATVVNYACHPTTLAWDNRLISPDYIGAMREVIERDTAGAPCLFLQGASGELSPREQYTGDLTIADANGRRLGYAALGVLDAMLPPKQRLAYAGVVESGAPLATWRREPWSPPATAVALQTGIDLPLKPMPTEAELQVQLAATVDRTMAERLRRKIRVVRQIGSGPTCPMPVWLWRFGDIILIGQANEAYSAFQLAMRHKLPDHAVVVMNLVNGACGYVTPPELHDTDIYQVWQSPFDRGALPILIAGCQRALEHI